MRLENTSNDLLTRAISRRRQQIQQQESGVPVSPPQALPMTNRRAKAPKSRKPKAVEDESQKVPSSAREPISATASAFASIASAASHADTEESSQNSEILKSSSAIELSASVSPMLSASHHPDAEALAPRPTTPPLLREGARSKNTCTQTKRLGYSEEMPSPPPSPSAISESSVPSVTVLRSSPASALLMDKVLVQIWVPDPYDVVDKDTTRSLKPPTASVQVPLADVLNLLKPYPEQSKKLTDTVTEVNARQTTPKRKRTDEETDSVSKRPKRSKNNRSLLSMLHKGISKEKYGFNGYDLKKAGLSGDIVHKRILADGCVKYYTQESKHRVGGPQEGDIIESEDGDLSTPDVLRAKNSSRDSKRLLGQIEEYNAKLNHAKTKMGAGPAHPQPSTDDGMNLAASVDAASDPTEEGMNSHISRSNTRRTLTGSQGAQPEVSDGQIAQTPVRQDVGEPVPTAQTLDSQTPSDRAQMTPATPRRAWGIGALVSTIPRSVSRYVPGFRRAPIPHFEAPANTDRNATTQSTSTVTKSTTTEPPTNTVATKHEPAIMGAKATVPAATHDEESTLLAQPNTEPTVNPPETPPAMTSDGITGRSALKRTVDGQTKEESLASYQDFIEEEVRRRVRVAMTIQGAAVDQTAIATRPRRLKKRPSQTPSPARIPNPPDCSYGMNLDYFPYDSSESESEDEIEWGPPAKRARTSEITPISQAHETRESHSLARPYVGTLFADPAPVPTPFGNSEKAKKHGTAGNLSSNPFQDISEKEKAHSGHFEVPYGSESDSDGAQLASPTHKPAKKTVHFAAEPINQPFGKKLPSKKSKEQSILNRPALNNSPAKQPTVEPKAVEPINTVEQPSPLSSPQLPPPAPIPAHAELPPVSLEASLAKAKAEATRYTPSKPSGLRAATRLSSSTVASEADADDRNDFGAGDSINAAENNNNITGNSTITASSLGDNNAITVTSTDVPSSANRPDNNNDSPSNDSEGQTSEDEPGTIVTPPQDAELSLDPEVSALVYSLPDPELQPITFPNGERHKTIEIDPEVTAALDAVWGPEDELQGSETFHIGFWGV